MRSTEAVPRNIIFVRLAYINIKFSNIKWRSIRETTKWVASHSSFPILKLISLNVAPLTFKSVCCLSLREELCNPWALALSGCRSQPAIFNGNRCLLESSSGRCCSGSGACGVNQTRPSVPTEDLALCRDRIFQGGDSGVGFPGGKVSRNYPISAPSDSRNVLVQLTWLALMRID